MKKLILERRFFDVFARFESLPDGAVKGPGGNFIFSTFLIKMAQNTLKYGKSTLKYNKIG